MNKPKPFLKQILSASEVKKFIASKYKKSGQEFWEWFFSECPWGDTNLLTLDEADDCYAGIYLNEDKGYVALLKKEFKKYASNEGCLEIENDL